MSLEETLKLMKLLECVIKVGKWVGRCGNGGLQENINDLREAYQELTGKEIEIYT